MAHRTFDYNDEGAEILEVQEGLCEAERGEIVDFDEAMTEIEAKIARAKRAAG